MSFSLKENEIKNSLTTKLILKIYGFYFIIPFKIYDKKLTIQLSNKHENKIIEEKCVEKCRTINLDFGTFSLESKKEIKFLMKNKNPIKMHIKNISTNSRNLEFKIDDNKIAKFLENINLNENEEIEIIASINTQHPQKEAFSILIHQEESNFEIPGVYNAIKG